MLCPFILGTTLSFLMVFTSQLFVFKNKRKDFIAANPFNAYSREEVVGQTSTRQSWMKKMPPWLKHSPPC